MSAEQSADDNFLLNIYLSQYVKILAALLQLGVKSYEFRVHSLLKTINYQL